PCPNQGAGTSCTTKIRPARETGSNQETAATGSAQSGETGTGAAVTAGSARDPYPNQGTGTGCTAKIGPARKTGSNQETAATGSAQPGETGTGAAVKAGAGSSTRESEGC
ncbi:MAG: hypothetical protein WCA04_08255, partial [Geobacteraceae bacterium]